MKIRVLFFYMNLKNHTLNKCVERPFRIIYAFSKMDSKKRSFAAVTE